MKRALVMAALVAALGTGIGMLAARAPEPEGRADIAFERARITRLPDTLLLDARARVQLPDSVRAGLDSGVPLEFVVALDVREPRRWWPDRASVDARWHYRLEYYELTRHYRLGATDEGTSRNYRSLTPALEALGTLRGLDLAVGTAAASNGGGRGLATVMPGQLATLEMRLDTGALPLPLRPLVSSSWRVSSEPLAWRIAPLDDPLDGSEG